MTKAEIQFVRSLSDKRVRDEERLFIAEGAKLIEEIQNSDFRIRAIYTTRKDVAGRGVEYVERKDMERISQLKTPADCVAIVEQPRHRLQLSSIAGNLVLALDGVQNPGNLGTILRLADWFGVRDVICSKECADCFNPKVVQATMGAILRVRVHYVDNLAQVLNEAKNLGMPIYGTLLDGENIYSKRLQNRGVIVMGNEGRGLSDECQEALTDRLFIPPYPANCPTSESLNVAMATGIIIAEFRRGKYEAE
ncbi:MAG: RNA methyltransferase [Alistipes sp.]|nr:RNA methyltransferase [Alistipes sp.]